MMRILYIVVLTVFAANGSLAQTFLGKHLFADAGITYRPNLLNVAQWSDNHFVKWNPFPPSFQAGVGLAATSRIAVRIEGSFQQHQLSGVKFQDEYLFDTINQKYIDSIYFDSKTIDFSVDLRFYQEYAPIGRYFSVHAGINSTTTTLIPVTSYWNVTPSTYYYSNNRNATTTVTYRSLKLGVGFGRTQLITRSLYLDFGFKSSLILLNRFLKEDDYSSLLGTLNAPSYKEGYSIDYRDTGLKVFTSGARRSLQNACLFEVYLNLGFSL